MTNSKEPEIIQEQPKDVQVSTAEKSALLMVISSKEYQLYLSDFTQEKDDLAPNWVYDNIDEVAKNCRKIFFMYLVLLSYSLLTVITTSDQDLILGQNVVLPVIKATVPIELFFIIVPALAIGMFVYIQLYLLKVNKLIKFAVRKCCEINRTNPKCLSKKKGDECSRHNICADQENRLYPWMIIFCKYSEEKILGKLQRLFTKFSLWLLLPITLIIFSLLIVKKHELVLSYILLFLTLLGMGIVFAFWLKNRQSEVSRSTPKSWLSKKINLILSFLFSFSKAEDQEAMGRKFQWVGKYFGGFSLLLIAIVCAVLLFFIIERANEGNLWSKNGPWNEEINFWNKRLRNFVLVDLSQKNLVDKTKADPEYHLLYWVDLEDAHLQGANLASSILTKANLKKANLKNANLIGATLEGAALDKANLCFAKLGDANLAGASLHNAQLRKSDLVLADLQGALLSYADLQGADFRKTNLSGAQMDGTNLFYTDLRQAKEISKDQIIQANNWQFAYYSDNIIKILGLFEDHNKRIKKKKLTGYDLSESNLNGANLKEADLEKADLTYADLRRANLQKANLRKTNLKEANLQWTDLRGVKNLRKDQLVGARNYKLAYYSREWQQKLDLLPDHNRRMEKKNLHDYKLQGANLQGADLKEASLSNVNLYEAKLQEANLQQAKLNGAILTYADLWYADLKGADLNEAILIEAQLGEANLEKANLKGANLSYANLQYADLRQAKGISKEQLLKAKNYMLALYSKDAIKILELPNDINARVKLKDFENCDFQGANLQGANLLRASFYKAKLQNADLWQAMLANANLREAKLKGAILRYAQLSDADLRGADLQKADLRGAILTGADLKEANLSGANLDHADLQHADLRDAIGISKNQIHNAKNYKLGYYSKDAIIILDLQPDHNERMGASKFEGYDFKGANLNGADLWKANLSSAKFNGADLSDAVLSDANLQNANLDGADLEKANLRYANLRGANLKMADLRDADLEGANLQGADLRKILFSNYDQFANVKTLYQAKLDKSFMIELQKRYPSLFNKPVM